ncbi:MAG: L-histidine N(alpha)-methyltransferase [Anaerolineales bacterium]
MRAPAAPSLASIQLEEIGPQLDDLRDEVLRGLAKPAKELPCKLFYDERGSALFDQICELDEYYLTRTETAIMQQNAAEIAALIGERCVLIEYGSGSSSKIRILLDHLHEPLSYVPIDLAKEMLLRSATAIAAAYPQLRVLPISADYTQSMAPPSIAETNGRRVAFFPGSTIGNFHLHDAEGFLQRVRDLVGREGGLLIGVDLKKDPGLLQSAYNDSAGFTAEFNRNILAHINSRFGSDFRLDQFRHRADYDERLGRIEMYLISLADQVVRFDGIQLPLRAGEAILTEVSYKYDLDQFAALAGRAGFQVKRVWSDPDQLFSVQFLAAP